jgi:arsenate reductase
VSGQTTHNLLFLCTGNSCRSILAECILNRIGKGRFRAYSAGSHPTGEVHPLALDLLQRRNHPVADLRSKSWQEFAGDPAPAMDFVVTVCDQAAGEQCPVWPGAPMIAHWGFPDPARFVGTDEDTKAFFDTVCHDIERLLSAFVQFPLDSMTPDEIRRKMRELEAEAPEQRRQSG